MTERRIAADAVLHCRDLLGEILSYVRPVVYINPTVRIYQIDDEQSDEKSGQNRERNEKGWSIDLELYLWNSKERQFKLVGIDTGIRRLFAEPSVSNITMIDWNMVLGKYITTKYIRYLTDVDLLSTFKNHGVHYIKVCSPNINLYNSSCYDEKMWQMRLNKIQFIKETHSICPDEHIICFTMQVTEYQAEWIMKYMQRTIERACARCYHHPIN